MKNILVGLLALVSISAHASLSADDVFNANNFMGPIAHQIGLGTLLQTGESSGTIADGKINIGNSSNAPVARTLSGDVTVTNAGVTAIGSAKVLKAMLATGVVPSHIVKFAGTFTTAGGDANESISVAGVLGTDLCFVQLKTKGGTPRTILTAVCGTDTIDMVLSGDPSTDHVIVYQVLRASS